MKFGRRHLRHRHRSGPFTGLTGKLGATTGATEWLEFAPAVSFSNTRFDGDRNRTRTAAGFAAAVSTRVWGSAFLGAQAAYLRSYDGTGLNRFAGEAIFFGPTLYTPLAENLELAGTFSTQVWGRRPGETTRLDLGNFNRHKAKLALSFAF